MDAEDKLKVMWNFILALTVVVVLTAAVVSIAAPKRIDGYYLSNANSSTTGMATCVWAHWTWHADERAFCTNDYQQAVDFLNKANASLKGQQ